MQVLDKNPAWLNVLKDVLLLLAGKQLINGIKALTGLLSIGGVSALLGGIGVASKGAGKTGGIIAGLLGGKAIAGAVGKKAVTNQAVKIGAKGAAAVTLKTVAKGAEAVPHPAVKVLGYILDAALYIPLVYDMIKGFFGKEENQDKGLEAEPIEQPQYQYRNIQSNMTNNFFNNPQPANAAINELNNAINRYTQYQYR